MATATLRSRATNVGATPPAEFDRSLVWVTALLLGLGHRRGSAGVEAFGLPAHDAAPDQERTGHPEGTEPEQEADRRRRLGDRHQGLAAVVEQRVAAVVHHI